MPRFLAGLRTPQKQQLVVFADAMLALSLNLPPPVLHRVRASASGSVAYNFTPFACFRSR